MPERAPRPCAARGCRALIQGGRYCAQHTPKVKRPDRRLSPSRRGYGRAWRQLRADVLKMDPFCRDPFGVHAERKEIVPASDVDHIIPRSAGGSDDLTNLQPLCHSCHSKKTAVQSSGWGRGDL